MLAKVDDPAVRAYVVWVPMNRGLERDVANATKEIWDARARHYWDPDGQLIARYRDVLGGYTEPVWDTFVVPIDYSLDVSISEELGTETVAA